MIELARHIEILLLENDCVIIPDFGGFIAHINRHGISRKKIFIFPLYVLLVSIPN